MNKKQAKRCRTAAYKKAKRQNLWKKLEGYVFEKRWRRFLAWLFPKKRATFEKWVAETYREQLKSWSKEAYSQIHDKELAAFQKAQHKLRRAVARKQYKAEAAIWERTHALAKERFIERQATIEQVFKEIEEE